ncbi:MAG TPA: hypothetical protein VN742_06780, partial [Candidatus Binataceae bacterium]|nr:hypothetical protein [Candidatus Binataceae bacterium]
NGVIESHRGGAAGPDAAGRLPQANAAARRLSAVKGSARLEHLLACKASPVQVQTSRFKMEIPDECSMGFVTFAK